MCVGFNTDETIHVHSTLLFRDDLQHKTTYASFCLNINKIHAHEQPGFV